MKKKMLLILLMGLFIVPFAFATGGKVASQPPDPAVSAGRPVDEIGIDRRYGLAEYEALSGKKLVFKEAPELASKVGAGQLPSVTERLPDEPLVVKPVDSIGKYGGTLRRATAGIAFGQNIYEWLVDWNYEQTEVIPAIVKAWEINSDGTSFTFHLRKGMKWSDGAPFTVDDFVFQFEDIYENEELTPLITSKLTIDGELGKIKKIDTYTFSITWSKPFGSFIERLASPYPPTMYAPKHYLEKYHPKYTPIAEIEAMMKEEGYSTWGDLFKTRSNVPYKDVYTDLPVIHAYYPLDPLGSALQRYVRNPYYWKVDIDGNQLPYIDKVYEERLTNRETILLKAIAGEIDYQAYYISGIKNFTPLKQREETGNYTIVPMESPGTNFGALRWNWFHKDPVMKELIRNKQFRIAVSIAINRQEISDLIFNGLAVPCQVTPAPTTPWYDEKLANAYIEYDVKEANKIFDKIGLKWDNDNKYRLRSDGKELRITILAHSTSVAQAPEIADLIKDYWAEIGINVVVKPMGGELLGPLESSLDYDVSCEALNHGYIGMAPATLASIIPYRPSASWGQLWGLWYESDGKDGEEPPPDVKRLFEIYEQYPTGTSAETRLALDNETIQIHGRLFLFTGIVRESPAGRFFLCSNNIGNAIYKSGVSVWRTASKIYPTNIAALYFK